MFLDIPSGIIKASFGIGWIRKLVMHHQVDRGEQSGGGFGITFPLTPSAVSENALDAVKSVSVSISGGEMVRLNGGKCIFDVPVFDVLERSGVYVGDISVNIRNLKRSKSLPNIHKYVVL